MMAFPIRLPSRFRSSADAVLMSIRSGSHAVEPAGSAATGCTTGAEVSIELGSGGVFAASGRSERPALPKGAWRGECATTVHGSHRGLDLGSADLCCRGAALLPRQLGWTTPTGPPN